MSNNDVEKKNGFCGEKESGKAQDGKVSEPADKTGENTGTEAAAGEAAADSGEEAPAKDAFEKALEELAGNNQPEDEDEDEGKYVSRGLGEVFPGTPSEIKARLDRRIVGQERAKKVLAVAAYNHYKRQLTNKGLTLVEELEKNPVKVEKSNILLVGPTGVGKTALVKALAETLNVPFASTDCTSLTANGFAGADPESCLVRLLAEAKGNVERAERGIIYLDEFDKISARQMQSAVGRDINGEEVQRALLRIMEGTVADVGKGARRNPNEETKRVDTTGILFIVGGAFQGIEQIIAKRLGRCTGGVAGFGASTASSVEADYNDLIDRVIPEDLAAFGMIPEILGRLPVLAPLHQLDEAALCRILTEPEDSLVDQFRTLFLVDRVDLEFAPEALRHVARTAMENGTGARGLRSIMENMLMDLMFEIPDRMAVEKIVIGADGEAEMVCGTGELRQKAREAVLERDRTFLVNDCSQVIEVKRLEDLF